MLAIPAFQARTQTALFRAGNKPPLEVVVANLEAFGKQKSRCFLLYKKYILRRFQYEHSSSNE